MAQAIAIEDEIGRPPLWAGPRVLRAEQLLWAGDLPAARALLEAAAAHAERQNHARWSPYTLYDLAAVESAAGNLRRADELLNQALEIARDCEDPHVEGWIFYRRALAATWLGRSDEARAAAARRLEAAQRVGALPGIARTRSVLGLLALSEGDAAAAASELAESARLLEAMGFAHPGAIPAVPDAIEAHALAGDRDAAAGLLERLEAQAARVASAWATAALERARGTVAFASGEDERAAESLEAAAEAFAALGFRPDAARATLLQGRALLHGGRRTAAADAFARARTEFAAMGASLWQARAGDALERAAPGRAKGELTPAERKIAALVTQGRTNREIGQTLFMSVATVEAHLTRTYRKLDIRSRSELTRLVAEGSVTLGARAAGAPAEHV